MPRSSKFVQNYDFTDFDRRLDKFVKGNREAVQGAARMATEASQAKFQAKLSGRPTVDPRRNRPTTQGAFGSYLLWRPEKLNRHLYAQFQWRELDRAAPYWVIQEIGTGNTAKILDQGRSVSIKSQRGRRIKPSLTFADASSVYRPPQKSRAREDQIVSVTQAKNAPLRPHPITINKEIPPKGFVRTGGRVGLSQYRSDLRQLMKRAFDR